MRQIKFRAWDKYSKVMRSWEDLILEKDDRDDYWLIGYRESRNIVSYDHQQILSQYTGLKDKNGVEIFEGDVVSTDLKRSYLIVEYRNGSFMFRCNDGGDDYHDLMVYPEDDVTGLEYHKVIGNIWENPELL